MTVSMCEPSIRGAGVADLFGGPASEDVADAINGDLEPRLGEPGDTLFTAEFVSGRGGQANEPAFHIAADLTEGVEASEKTR
jgi:hypothetical protein